MRLVWYKITISSADIEAKIEPSEEYLVVITVINHTNNDDMAIIGLIAKITPKDVATPFPPLKLRKTVNICPNIAVMPVSKTKKMGK